MKRFTLSLFMLLAFAGVTQAALNAGNYFIKSYNGKYLTENNASHTLICSDRLTNSYAQVWAVEVNGTNVSLCNLLTGRYIKGSTTTYQQWSTTPDIQQFTYAESSGNYTFAWSENWGMHCDGSNVTVGWYTSDDKSKWTLETADVDPTDLLNQRLAFATATADQLTTFFTTTACTELKSDYASMSDADLRSAMSALPTTVQDMAVKVKNHAWTTYDGWDKTESTFRVADYSAYSNYSRWTSILNLKYNLARIENPTGIWVDEGDYLQVYVGDIPSGQTVQLVVAGYGAGGYGGSAINFYALQEGMNTLQVTAGGNCFVCYQVDNTTNGQAPFTALSAYAPVTVHIEGGTVQGYFDLTRGDDNDDWTQLKRHLMTKDMFCMKTKTLVFSLQTDLVKTAVDGADGTGSTGELVEMLNYWQGVQDMEDDLFNRASLAGTDNKYCNNVHSVTTIGNSGAGLLYAYTNGIYFSPEQHNRLFNNKLIREGSDNLWAAAHELGHHRQNPINMVGNTEISNNIYSNVAVYQQGRYTSRTASIQETFRDFAAGLSWPERVRLANISATSGSYNQQLLHLNWQLYQYFHILGNDPDFFPSLFAAFRADPMSKIACVTNDDVITEARLTPASTDYLKYYVKCCEVSGYDLTDFFAAYGFFMLPPEQATAVTYNGITSKSYVTIGDYGTYDLYVTQEMIDAAKAQVAAMSGLRQCNIIFIEDRVTAPIATYDGHAEGETKRANDACNVTFGSVGETGQYTDFGVTPSAYAFNVSERGNVTVSGTGAVGFIVRDGDGNIVGFYNTTTFTLPESAFDENGLKSGYTLQAAAGDGSAAAMTKDENIKVNEFPLSGVFYTFCTPLRNSRFMRSSGAGQGVVGAETSTTTPDMQWEFVFREGETETFDIVNRQDQSYLDPSATYNSQIMTSASQPSAGWKIAPAATKGLYIIYSGTSQLNQTSVSGNPIYNWGGGSNTGDAGCQFAIEVAVDDLSTTALAELDGLNIAVATEAADNLATGQWYVMFDRGANHGYLYEKATSHTLYNTNTVPSGTATEAARFLVRLIQAPGDGMYYLQTGFGNYFWNFPNRAAVATTPYSTSRIKVTKIAGTDGHFYLQCVNNSVVLDANVTTSGDATVVGYGTTVPTATGGNNDWAFYPVTFTCPVHLNASGYATFAGPYAADYSDASPFSAWQVTEVNGETITFSQITGQAAAGTGVLLKGEANTTVNIALTNLNDGTDYSATNQLVGITTPTAITAGTYYGLSGNTFVRVNPGIVPARKALLPAGVVNAASGVKALTFVFNDADGIEAISNEEIVNSQSLNSKCYSLSGQRLAKPQRGINIVDGKKVVVK